MTELKTMSHRKIGGIKLLNTGLKGVEITYETVETIGGQVYTSEDNKKSNRPAHRELKSLVKNLGAHLMVLCGYENELRLPDFEVVSIKAGSDRFLISGKYRCWDDKIIAVNTPLIKEVDGYDGYDEVSKLVDEIYREADLYLKGVKKIKKSEVITDYMKDIKKNEGFDVDSDFGYMSEDEMAEMLDGFQKDLGITVKMENGRMVITSDDEEGEVEGISDEVVKKPGEVHELPVGGVGATITKEDFKTVGEEVNNIPSSINNSPVVVDDESGPIPDFDAIKKQLDSPIEIKDVAPIVTVLPKKAKKSAKVKDVPSAPTYNIVEEEEDVLNDILPTEASSDDEMLLP